MPGADPQGDTPPPPLAGVIDVLRRTQPWTRFMAIMIFLSVGFMLVFGIVAGLAGLATREPETLVLLFIYPVAAVLYFFPGLYLLRYSRWIRQFVAGGQVQQLEAALDAQRAFWTFVGVLSIVGIVLGIAFVVIAVAGFAMLAGTRF